MNDQPKDFSVKPTLVGEKVVLRPFLLEEDAPALRSVLQDPEVGRLTGSDHGPADPEPWDDAAEERMREWYGTRHEQCDRLDLAVVDRAIGACVGASPRASGKRSLIAAVGRWSPRAKPRGRPAAVPPSS